MVLASSRIPLLSPTLEPIIAASSGAHTAGSVSSGSSTTFKWLVSRPPNASVKKSNSLAAFCANSLPACWWLTVRYPFTFPAPAVTGPTYRPAITVPGNPGLVQLKSNWSPGFPLASVTGFEPP